MTTVDDQFEHEVWRAVRPYNVGILSLYDVGVYGIWNPKIWSCSSETIKDFYRRHVRAVHLEAGCGTGYLPAHCMPSRVHRDSQTPVQLTLLDFSPSGLKWSARRLSSYHPRLLHHNLFLPLPPVERPFDSICLNYVLHCLPGDFERKQVVIGHLKAVLAPGGVLFGSTILGKASASGWRARRMLDLFNTIGSFHNLTDTQQGLRSALSAHFEHVTCRVEGTVALFAASDQPLP